MTVSQLIGLAEDAVRTAVDAVNLLEHGGVIADVEASKQESEKALADLRQHLTLLLSIAKAAEKVNHNLKQMDKHLASADFKSCEQVLVDFTSSSKALDTALSAWREGKGNNDGH